MLDFRFIRSSFRGFSPCTDRVKYLRFSDFVDFRLHKGEGKKFCISGMIFFCCLLEPVLVGFAVFKPFFSAQFHPEATAGPTDTEYLIKSFIDTAWRLFPFTPFYQIFPFRNCMQFPSIFLWKDFFSAFFSQAFSFFCWYLWAFDTLDACITIQCVRSLYLGKEFILSSEGLRAENKPCLNGEILHMAWDEEEGLRFFSVYFPGKALICAYFRLFTVFPHFFVQNCILILRSRMLPTPFFSRICIFSCLFFPAQKKDNIFVNFLFPPVVFIKKNFDHSGGGNNR